MPEVRVGIDVGGTFTDTAMIGADGRLRISKVPSTPADLSAGFVRGLDVLLQREGIAPADVSFLAHGTTVATNAIVQRRLARSALLTTHGFRDILEIGSQQRPRLYDLWQPKQQAVIAHDDCYGIRERIGPEGDEIEPLHTDDVRAAAARIRDDGRVEAVAVVLLFSFLNPAHELRIREILAEELPGIPVTLSCEVAPEVREYVRASTVALNATLLPLAGGYVARLAEVVAGRGVRVPIHLMRSNGGLAAASTAARIPVALVSSGPAAGVIGAARLGNLAGLGDLLTFDMGGTTADVAAVHDAKPTVRYRGVQYEHPVNLPQIDVLSVGAGGGSIARVDAFGAVLVGPESAGATPGPACYNQGGTLPTVTDAHLVLGVLGERRALGGDVKLDIDAARAAVRHEIAQPLGFSVDQAAAAVIRVANANMASALRVVSVARGHDPRQMTLVAFGGAGPMHGCALADELGMARILVPRYPGVTAALGLLLSEIRHDLGESWVRATAALTPEELHRRFEAIGARARGLLAETGHATGGTLAFAVDMRYVGQAYSLTVGASLGDDPLLLDSLERSFVEQHRHTYGYVLEEVPTEIVAVRVSASVQTEPARWELDEREPQFEERRVADLGHGPSEVPVLDRSGLPSDSAVVGPAIIEQEDSTTVVSEGWNARVVAGGSLLLSRNEP